MRIMLLALCAMVWLNGCDYLPMDLPVIRGGECQGGPNVGDDSQDLPPDYWSDAGACDLPRILRAGDCACGSHAACITSCRKRADGKTEAMVQCWDGGLQEDTVRKELPGW